MEKNCYAVRGKMANRQIVVGCNCISELAIVSEIFILTGKLPFSFQLETSLETRDYVTLNIGADFHGI